MEKPSLVKKVDVINALKELLERAPGEQISQEAFKKAMAPFRSQPAESKTWENIEEVRTLDDVLKEFKQHKLYLDKEDLEFND